MSDSTNIWEGVEIISRYSRAQAIEDGVLVDMMQDNFGRAAREAGFKFPIAMTTEAYHTAVALTPAAKAMGCDLTGRFWDVLTMLRLAIKQSAPGDDTVFFKVLVVSERRMPSVKKFKCVIGPGDDPAPVMTIMLPEQD